MHADGDVDQRERHCDRHKAAVEPRWRSAILAEIDLQLLLRGTPPADPVLAGTGECLSEGRHGPVDVLHIVDDERRLEAAEGQREAALRAVREEDGTHARPEAPFLVAALRTQDVGDREGRRRGRLRVGRPHARRQDQDQRQRTRGRTTHLADEG